MRRFLQKVINMRKAAMRSGGSHKCAALMLSDLKKLNGWLQAYPKASEDAVRKFCRKHHDSIIRIMPGKSAQNHDTLINQFNTLLNQ